MGANHSSRTPLESYSAEDIAGIVSSFGAKYIDYVGKIKESGIDGAFLASLDDNKFVETLEDLEITSRLHQRKLLNEFRKESSIHTTAEKTTPRRALSLDSACSSISSCNSAEINSVDYSDHSSITMRSDLSSISGAVEALAYLQSGSNNVLRWSFSELINARRTSGSGSISMRSPPRRSATIVLTDIEGSTNLWESDPEAMHKALNLHNQLIRRLIAQHFGYEVRTEGDSFTVAFHEAADALEFALCMQEALNTAPWDDGILALPWAKEDSLGRRGLRVRVSVHMGRVKTRKDPITGRLQYNGAAMTVAKSLESIAMGGQIVTSYETWNAAFQVADSQLGSPMLAPLGVHKVASKKNCTSDPVVKRILEIAPASLNIMGTPKDQ